MNRNLKSFLFFVLCAALIAAAFLVKETSAIFYYVFLAGGIVIGADALLTLLLDSARKKRRDGGSFEPDAGQKEPPEYRRKKSMLTNVERKFYYILLELFGEKYDVIYQVPLNNVIDKITQNSYRNELFRVADFCLVSKSDFAPLLLIELNDSSHNRPDRIERDKKVGEICSRAKMPIVAFKTDEISDYAHIKRVVKSNILKN